MLGREQKAQSSSPAPRPQTQNDGRRSSKGNAPRRQFSFRKQNPNACRQCRDGNCTNPRCIDHVKSRIKPEGCGYGHAQESGTTSDQATDHLDRRSVRGGMIVYNGELLCFWSRRQNWSRRQKAVSLSSWASEVHAAMSTGAEALCPCSCTVSMDRFSSATCCLGNSTASFVTVATLKELPIITLAPLLRNAERHRKTCDPTLDDRHVFSGLAWAQHVCM